MSLEVRADGVGDVANANSATGAKSDGVGSKCSEEAQTYRNMSIATYRTAKGRQCVACTGPGSITSTHLAVFLHLRAAALLKEREKIGPLIERDRVPTDGERLDGPTVSQTRSDLLGYGADKRSDAVADASIRLGHELFEEEIAHLLLDFGSESRVYNSRRWGMSGYRNGEDVQ